MRAKPLPHAQWNRCLKNYRHYKTGSIKIYFTLFQHVQYAQTARCARPTADAAYVPGAPWVPDAGSARAATGASGTPAALAAVVLGLCPVSIYNKPADLSV